MKRCFSILILVSVGYFLSSHTVPTQTSQFVWQPNEFFTFLEKEKQDTLFINFWATWCKPCVEEMPDLLAVTKEKNIPSYFFSLDDSDIADKVKSFIKSKGWNANFNLIDITNFDTLINVIDPKWEGAIPFSIYYINGKSYSHYNKFETKSEIETFLNQK